MPTMLLKQRIRNRRWAYCLRIAGHPTAYHSGPTPPAEALPNTWTDDGPGWSTLNAITHISPYNESRPQIGGVTQQSPITITLASSGDARPPAGDPMRAFSRLGVPGAQWWGQMTAVDPGDGPVTTLRATIAPPFDIHLDRAPPTITDPVVIHIGQEAFIATAAGGSEAGGEDPWHITITARSIADTVARRHEARTATRDLPIVTLGHVVFWRSRRAVLLAYQVFPSRRVGVPVEIMRGFIESTPEPGDDGISFDVELVPLTALLSQDGQTLAQNTRLVRDLHYFEPGIATDLWIGETCDRWEAQLAAPAAVSAGFLLFEPDDVAPWVARYDPTLSTTHPRAGALGVSVDSIVRAYGVASVDGGPPADTFTLLDPDNPPRTHAAGTIFRTAQIATAWRRGRILDHEDGAQILRWPGPLGFGDTGAAGRLESELFTAAIADGWTFPRLASGNTIITSTVADGVGCRCYLYLGDDIARHAGAAQEPWYREPGPPFFEDDPRLADPVSYLRYPVRVDAAESVTIITLGRQTSASAPSVIARFDVPSGHAIFPSVTCARAWYQKGERYLLLEDDIDISDGWLAIEGRGVSQLVEVNPISAEIVVPALGSDRDGAALRLVELRRPFVVDDFGEWSDDDAVVIRATRPAFAHSGDFLAHLLTSPDHLALGAGDIDLGSILGAGADPSWIKRWAVPDSDERLTYADIVSGVLRATRSMLTMRTDDEGRCRVTRIAVGSEDPSRVAAVIGAVDWAADPRPRTGTNDEIINEVTIRAQYENAAPVGEDPEFEWAIERTHESRTSQRLFEQTSPSEIDLYAAVEADPFGDDIEQSARNVLRLYEQPRREWEGTVGAWLGAVAHLGSTVQVTSRHLRDYAGEAVTEEYGVVVARTVDLWGESGCKLTIEHTGVRALGWAPAMRVASVPDPAQLVVEAHAYSAPDGPEDLDVVLVGDFVMVVPACNQDAWQARTVTAINRATRTVTVNAAHGLIARDVVCPAVWGSAADHYRVFAYMADAGGTLGAGNDAGARYV